MAIFFENYDLDFFQENEEMMRGLWALCLREGKIYHGYSGDYANYHLGSVQMVIRIQKEKDNWEAVGIDTHNSGRCVWNVRVTNTLPCKDSDPLERRCVVKRADDGGGMAVVNIINADVLPSYAEGEEIQLQMVAASSDFHYYASEEDYMASLEKDERGKIWSIAEGSLFSSGLLRKLSNPCQQEEVDEELDQYVMMRAKVKELYLGRIQLGEEEHERFIRCIVDTQFGELEFVHTYDQVPEEERENIRVGATLSGVFILSGDAAIYEYENGLVRDRENHLKLLRHSITQGDPERMHAVLAKDAVYHSETLHKVFHGPDEIVGHFAKVAQEGDSHYFVQTATIVELKENDESLYPVGTRCAILSQNEPEKYESLAFVDLDDEGNIKRLLITADSRYRFRLDPKPKDPVVELPDSVVELVAARALFMDLVDRNDVTCDELAEWIMAPGEFQENAKQIAEQLCMLPESTFDEELRKSLGDLFEKTLKEEFPILTPEIAEEIGDAHETGSRFERDFHFLHPEFLPEDKEWRTELVLTLTAVQVIAIQYAGTIASSFKKV